jgi:RNA polymerase sigma-70 factor (ECF subfamily)
VVATSALDSTREQRDRTDEQLLGAVADDPSALGELYDRYSSMVYGLALKVVANAQEAEDLTQEVFLALCEEHRFDPARGTVGAYLTTLVRSRAIDRLRRRSTRVRRLKDWKTTAVPVLEPPVSPLEKVSAAQAADRVRAAMTQLSDKERTVLEMAYYRGLTQTEIAEDLAAPLGTVKSWSRRALQSLKGALGDLVE